jgi:hypothetical protein
MDDGAVLFVVRWLGRRSVVLVFVVVIIVIVVVVGRLGG